MTLDRRSFLAALATAAAALPIAGRAMAEQGPASAPAEPGARQIGMLLYPGFTALDYVGPYHFLAGALGPMNVHIVTNQATLAPVPSDLGLAIQPTTTMADCPADLAVLFVPGGTVGTIAAARDAATIDFVRDRARRATYVTSVCTGSLILGVAGVLQGKRATSHWSVVQHLAQFGATPVRERVVRDGNVITGAGVSAGLDFGVTLVEELGGRDMAEAGVLMSEYAPQPPIDGGTLDTARTQIAQMLGQALKSFTDEAATLQIAG